MSELNQTFASGPFFKRYSVTLSYSLLHEVLNNVSNKLCLAHIVNATQASNIILGCALSFSVEWSKR